MHVHACACVRACRLPLRTYRFSAPAHTACGLPTAAGALVPTCYQKLRCTASQLITLQPRHAAPAPMHLHASPPSLLCLDPAQVVRAERRQSDGTPLSCSICLEEVAVGDSLRTLPCMHTYHQQCVDKWLSEKAACPVCQRSVKG